MPTHEGGFDPAEYEVAEIDKVTAAAFVAEHHYERSYPAHKSAYGLFGRCGKLAGVCAFSTPQSKHVLPRAFPSLDPHHEACELGRLVLLDEVKSNGESWFVARCFELMSKAGYRGVISFSDPYPRRVQTPSGDSRLVMPGHVGTVYQASNALYTGRSHPETLWYLPDGTVMSPRALSKARNGERGGLGLIRRLMSRGAPPRGPSEDTAAYVERALVSLGASRVRHPGKHRYLFTLGKQRRLVPVALVGYPYPKKEDGCSVAAAAGS